MFGYMFVLCAQETKRRGYVYTVDQFRDTTVVSKCDDPVVQENRRWDVCNHNRSDVFLLCTTTSS